MSGRHAALSAAAAEPLVRQAGPDAGLAGESWRRVRGRELQLDHFKWAGAGRYPRLVNTAEDDRLL